MTGWRRGGDLVFGSVLLALAALVVLAIVVSSEVPEGLVLVAFLVVVSVSLAVKARKVRRDGDA